MNYGAIHKDSVVITVRVPPAVADRLKQDAKVLDWSASHLIRRILSLYVSRELRDSVYDLIPRYKESRSDPQLGFR